MNVNFYTPGVTAFYENGELDIKVNNNIYDNLLDGVNAALLILGCCGEIYYQNM